MFYVAEALLVSRGLRLSKHSSVIAAYGQHYAKTGRLDPAFHRHLMQAQQERLIGDYRMGQDLTTADARLHIERAREFFAAARAYLEHETDAP